MKPLSSDKTFDATQGRFGKIIRGMCNVTFYSPPMQINARLGNEVFNIWLPYTLASGHVSVSGTIRDGRDAPLHVSTELHGLAFSTKPMKDKSNKIWFPPWIPNFDDGLLACAPYNTFQIDTSEMSEAEIVARAKHLVKTKNAASMIWSGWLASSFNADGAWRYHPIALYMLDEKEHAVYHPLDEPLRTLFTRMAGMSRKDVLSLKYKPNRFMNDLPVNLKGYNDFVNGGLDDEEDYH